MALEWAILSVKSTFKRTSVPLPCVARFAIWRMQKRQLALQVTSVVSTVRLSQIHGFTRLTIEVFLLILSIMSSSFRFLGCRQVIGAAVRPLGSWASLQRKFMTALPRPQASKLLSLGVIAGMLGFAASAKANKIPYNNSYYSTTWRTGYHLHFPFPEVCKNIYKQPAPSC